MRIVANTTLALTLALVGITACKGEKAKPSVADDMAAASKAKRKQNAQEAGAVAGAVKPAAAVPEAAPTLLAIGERTLEFHSPYKATKDVAKSADLKSSAPEIVDAGFYMFNVPAREAMAAYTSISYSVAPSLDGALQGIVDAYKRAGYVESPSNAAEDVSQRVGLPAKMVKGTLSKSTPSGQTYDQFVNMVIQSENDIVIFQGFFDEPDGQASESFQKTVNSLKLKHE